MAKRFPAWHQGQPPRVLPGDLHVIDRILEPVLSGTDQSGVQVEKERRRAIRQQFGGDVLGLLDATQVAAVTSAAIPAADIAAAHPEAATVPTAGIAPADTPTAAQIAEAHT